MSPMAAPTAPTRLGATILAWLLAQLKEEGTRSQLGGALKPLLAPRNDEEQRRTVDDALGVLERAGSISRPRRGALKLTPRGKHAGRDVLRVKELLEKKDWQAVNKNLLCARALDVGPFPPSVGSKRPSNLDRLRVAIVARHYRIKVGDAPTPKQVRDALAWRAIGIETDKPFTLAAARGVLLNRMLGEAKHHMETTKPLPTKEELLTEEKVLVHLAARAVGVGPEDGKGLPTAVLRRWLAGEGTAPEVEPVASTATVAVAGTATKAVAGTTTKAVAGTATPVGLTPSLLVTTPVELLDGDDAFAARVLTAARAAETGRFGDNKVFISHVFRRLVDEGATARDPESFKARLVAAHRRGLLSLSRADLVEAMDPEDVGASETRYLSATFHFVRTN